MIIGIGGWERAGKTGLAAIIASYPEIINKLGFQEYDIIQGFGNLTLYDTPYPWYYKTKKEIKHLIRNYASEQIRNTLFIIDEADQMWNPRGYVDREQTLDLEGIGQHAKMDDVFIYTYQKGQPGDALLGVDKLLRSNTRVDFLVKYYNPKSDFTIYTLENRHIPGLEIQECVLPNFSSYFHLWDHKEPVV